MSDTTIARPAARATSLPDVATGFGRWFRNPWRKPIFLKGVTWGYLAWSILPVLVAIVFSFNAGRSRSTWQGFSLRWWWEDPTDSLWRDPALRSALFQSVKLSVLTMLIAVPLGTSFAIALDRWRGRPASVANFAMLFSFLIPEIIVGVSLFLVITFLLRDFVKVGTTAQVIGLVTYQLSYPVIVVRARLLSIGKEYEEAAMDLGARPGQAIRRVLLPLLYPSIFASLALVFADSVDDFVTVRYLCGAAGCEPLSVKIYGAARASPTPAVNAAATFMLISTLLAITIGVLLYRFATRGQRKAEESGVQGFMSFEI
ncbi:MAG: ABC transporter permease [Actinomycetota bacterium]